MPLVFAYRPGPRRPLVFAGICAVHVLVAIALLQARRPPPQEPELPAVMVSLTDTERPEARPAEVPAPLFTVAMPSATLPALDLEAPPEEARVAVTAPAAITVAASAPAPRRPGEEKPLQVSDVDYLLPPAPRYPLAARRARSEGVAQVLVLVDESGRARSVQIYRSSGHETLDQAALDAVRGAVFRPYAENGVARSVQVIVPISFSLNLRIAASG